MVRVTVSSTTKQSTATNPTEAECSGMKPSREKSKNAVLRRRQYQRRKKARKASFKARGAFQTVPLETSLKYATSDRVKMTEEREQQIWLTLRKQERRWLEHEIMPNKSIRVSERQKVAFIQITRFEYEEERSNALCDNNDRVSQVVKNLFIMVNRERGRARAEQGIASHTDPVEDWWGPKKPPIDHWVVLKDDSMDEKYLTRPPALEEDDMSYLVGVIYHGLGKDAFMLNTFADEEEWLNARLLVGSDRKHYESHRGHILYKHVNKKGQRVQSRRPLMKFGPLLPGIDGPDVQISTVETAEMSDSRTAEIRSEEKTWEHQEMAGVEEEVASIQEEGSGIEGGETELAIPEDWAWCQEWMEQAKPEKLELEEAGVGEEDFKVDEAETDVATQEGSACRSVGTDKAGSEEFEMDEVDEQPRTPEAQIMPDYYT